ncbi:S26 family signal peptidase [Citricoccus zhacaiensis]|uniref:Signal peptidase I n=1 Tax=Citricoccus zhacaiensis TaxID=489142 RepID=A0ABQ2M059_9MICC|nr:signal peptidase I [Citricoccus zhacaiensis]GGO45251.1 S26 family signal peptidase [Citricoccus zhacaiensis]
MSTPRDQHHFRAPIWLQRIGQAISFLILCVSALAAVVLIIVPLVTGSQTYSVLTSSMAPSYPPGTFLVVKPTDFDALHGGDVITYQMESGRPEVITHRITSLTASQDGERMLITQGDNNDVADPDPVMEIQVRGKLVYAVPYVGFLANALGQTDRSGIITILAVALITYGLYSMVRGIAKERSEKRVQDIVPTASDTFPADTAREQAWPRH